MSAGHELGVSPGPIGPSDPQANNRLSEAGRLPGNPADSGSACNDGHQMEGGDTRCKDPQASTMQQVNPSQEPVGSSACPASVAQGADARAEGARCPQADAKGGSTNGQLGPFGEGASQPADEPPKCPLGFGSDNRAKLGPMNCILCQALYFDAIRTQCGHAFCRVCADKGELCAICGADARPLQADSDMQGTVDKYIDVHSQNHKLTADGQVAPQDEAKVQHPHAAKAAFLLQIGLRSLAGGNLPAASDRLKCCHSSLLAQVEDEDTSAAEQLALQIGAVCGSQGDCAMRQGDADGAAAKYVESMQHLKAAKQTPEVVHATSVTLNKVGDLQYMKQDLRGARAMYQQSLELRQEHSQSAGEKVDLAASHVKVGDVAEALEDAAAANKHFNVAKELLAPFAAECIQSRDALSELSHSDRRKLDSLHSFLASR